MNHLSYPRVRRFLLHAIFNGALLMAFSGAALAESKPDKQKEQVLRLQQALRAANTEKAQLSEEKFRLENAVKESEVKLESASRTAASATRRNAVLESEQKATRAELAELRNRFADLEQKERDESIRLTTTLSLNSTLRGDLEASRAQLKSCEGKNVALYRYGQELMERYENKGVLSALLAAEPFTGLKRVQIENVLEEYRDKLDGQRVGTATSSTKAGN